MMTIPIELISTKNSKDIASKTAMKTRMINGKMTTYKGKVNFLINSKAAQKNKHELIRFMAKEENRKLWEEEIRGKSFPYRFCYFIYRKEDRHFDYNNITQGLFDAMQFAKWLPEDDMRHLIPIPMGWKHDKENPRIEFFILNDNQNVKID